MEHINTNFEPRPNYSPTMQENCSGYNNQRYRQDTPHRRGGRFSGSFSGPQYPQGGWRWGSPQSADNYGSPNQFFGRQQRQFQSPPQYSSTPRKPFHHNQRRGNFHQQRNQGPRFHHGNTQSGGSATENIENWISPIMWEDPWLHLLPLAPVSDPRLSETEQDAIGETLPSDIDTHDKTEYYSALDTSILNTASASYSVSSNTRESDEPVSIRVEDTIFEPAINVAKVLESEVSEVSDDQNAKPFLITNSDI